MTRSRQVAQVLLILTVAAIAGSAQASDFPRMLRAAQAKVVKIYGAGGVRQLEAYQSGILISSDGQILTALSYVLDTDDLIVILDDGRKWSADLLGSDPVSELAVLQLRGEDHDVPHFDLHESVAADVGDRVLALSNLYGIATGNEPVSVLQGVVTAIAPLDARRGAYQANFRDNVYVIDAYSNNPGAAGGALIDWQGRLIGVLGKELRSRVTGTWLNYALPGDRVASIVDDIIAGRENRAEADDRLPPDEALTSHALGFMLVPNVLARTPPYVDTVRPHTPAAQAGMKTDDLVVFVDGQPISSCEGLIEELSRHEASEPITISVIRDGELLEFSFHAASEVLPAEDIPAP